MHRRATSACVFVCSEFNFYYSKIQIHKLWQPRAGEFNFYFLVVNEPPKETTWQQGQNPQMFEVRADVRCKLRCIGERVHLVCSFVANSNTRSLSSQIVATKSMRIQLLLKNPKYMWVSTKFLRKATSHDVWGNEPLNEHQNSQNRTVASTSISDAKPHCSVLEAVKHLTTLLWRKGRIAARCASRRVKKIRKIKKKHALAI